MSRRVLRHAEQGSVTIVVAALWMGLFGMAALAVDAGHMYLTKRNLQDAADAAVMAGLPSLGSSPTTAQTNARNMAIKCGYPTGNITAVGAAGAPSTLTVTITASEPFFFAKVLGYASKTVTATAVGQANSPVPAIFAGTNTCVGVPTPVGIQFNGGPIDVTGDIESNGSANVYGSANITGSSTYGGGGGCTSNIGGAANSGGSLAYPYSYTTSSFGACTFGSLTTPGDFPLGTPGPFWATGGPSGGTLKPGVYCANGNISLGANTVVGTVTFVATGTVTIGSASANLTAFSNGIIAYAGAASDCYSNQAINIGNADVVLNGSFDAPNGCINAGGANITINGSLVGNAVQIGVGGTSSINPAGGGGAGYWMFQ
ncbi:MAG: pilus assembly protein TadG-related protein [Polyangia bacterium]